MSFANTVLQQRERESKALRFFLACSLVGSLLFHIVLLASGIGRLLNRIPQVEDEPVEITLLDTPIEEIEPKEEVKPKPKPEPEPKKIEPEPEIKPPVPDTTEIEPDLEIPNPESQISGGNPSSLPEPIPTQPRITPEAPSVTEPLPKPKPIPFEPFQEPFTPPVVTRQQPVIPEPKPEPIPENNIPTQQEPELPAPVEPPIELPTQPSQASEDLKRLLAQQRDSRTTAINPPIQPPAQPSQQDNQNLRDTLSGIRKNRDTAPSLPDSSIGESSDNTPRRRRLITEGNQVATAPGTNNTDNGNGLGKGTGDSVGDGDGRAACRQCNTNYPSWAKANGIEGNVTVSVDTDAQGNVTNVQLISGSGNSRLDNYHLNLARKWKLKPSSQGRQGVTIITRYEIQ